MTSPVIRVEGISKRYRLGLIGSTTFRESVERRLKQFGSLIGVRERTRDETTRLSGGAGLPHVKESAKGDFWALRDVSFEVQSGEILGIIGRNGAGKSTLLKIMSRITEPTSGRAIMHGRVASLIEVGTGFHPELTGRENIFLNGAILGMPRAEVTRKYDEIVEFSGIEEFINTPVKRYSSGMYMRLGFAVAAHLEPDILVIDEVLAVGDASFQKKCLGKMESVAKQGRTVLFVSHNMAAIRQLCSRAIWLDHGRIRDEGDVNAVVDAYLAADQPVADPTAATFPVDTEKEFQVIRVRLLDQTGKATGFFTCDEPVVIELTCRLARRLPGLRGYMELRKKDGTVVLVSDAGDGGCDPMHSLIDGSNVVTIAVPPRSLGHGDYEVYLSFASISAVRNFVVDAPGIVCGFRLDDHKSGRGNLRGGHLSTLLDWRLNNGGSDRTA